jgi:hypothetical protein
MLIANELKAPQLLRQLTVALSGHGTSLVYSRCVLVIVANISKSGSAVAAAAFVVRVVAVSVALTIRWLLL